MEDVIIIDLTEDAINDVIDYIYQTGHEQQVFFAGDHYSKIQKLIWFLSP